MQPHRVFIVGSSLFAETLAQILGDSQTVTVIGTASTAEEALFSLESQYPDAVIFAEASEVNVSTFVPVMIAHPDLPIFHADLNTNQVHVITNQSIDARMSDLLAAIEALPRRDTIVEDETLDVDI